MTRREYDEQTSIEHLKAALTHLRYARSVVHKEMHGVENKLDGAMSTDLVSAEIDLKSAELFIKSFIKEMRDIS